MHTKGKQRALTLCNHCWLSCGHLVPRVCGKGWALYSLWCNGPAVTWASWPLFQMNDSVLYVSCTPWPNHVFLYLYFSHAHHVSLSEQCSFHLPLFLSLIFAWHLHHLSSFVPLWKWAITVCLDCQLLVSTSWSYLDLHSTLASCSHTWCWHPHTLHSPSSSPPNNELPWPQH